MNSSLQFDKFKVLEMKYQFHIDGEDTDLETDLEPKFTVNVGISKDDVNKGIVRLSVKIGNEEYGFEYVFVEVIGFFTFDNKDNHNEKEIHNFYRINGTAILFPYLRSIVSDLTSKSDESPIILPTINVNSFFEEEEEE